MFGKDSPTDLICTAQTLSGTGALYVGAKFLKKCFTKVPAVLIPDPSWPIHMMIFENLGFEQRIKYPYYNAKSNSLNFEGIMDCFKTAPDSSIVVLHACAHNPTGVDPTKE